MNRTIRRLSILAGFLALAAPLQGQRLTAGNNQYPNVDRPVVLGPGDTVQLLIRFMNDGGPAMRTPGKRLDFVFSTSIPAAETAARQAQADRAAQHFGVEAVDLGLRRISVGICDSRPCAQRRHPPAEWYQYERTNTGWRRVP